MISSYFQKPEVSRVSYHEKVSGKKEIVADCSVSLYLEAAISLRYAYANDNQV